MRYTYVKNWTNGHAVHANTGDDWCDIYRFPSKQAARDYCTNYRAPNHCPQAFAEIVTRKEVESSIRTLNSYGDAIRHWIVTEDHMGNEVEVIS